MLSRFTSYLTDKCIEVFMVLKNHKSFEWTIECKKAFEDLKGYLTNLPILLKPKDGEELYNT